MFHGKNQFSSSSFSPSQFNIFCQINFHTFHLISPSSGSGQQHANLNDSHTVTTQLDLHITFLACLDDNHECCDHSRDQFLTDLSH